MPACPPGPCCIAGLTALQDLSLAGCEQLTALGLRWVAGLTRLRRLTLQTCHRIRWGEGAIIQGLCCTLCALRCWTVSR